MTKLFSLLTRYRWIILPVGGIKWVIFQVWLIHDWYAMDLSLAVWDTVVSNVLLAGIAVAIINLLLMYIPSLGKFWFALILSVMLAAAWQWVTMEAMQERAADNVAYLNFMAMGAPVRGVIGFLVLAGVSVGGIFFNQLEEQLKTARRESDTQALAREAELQKLQLQLQPHFLFNSLNSINAMILVKPAEARVMVEQLSEFLRITTRRADELWISLEEEWRYVELYLSIERVRFGHRLQIQTSLSEEAKHRRIPTLLLQPLVENAIKFGLYGTTGEITITLTAVVENDLLSVKVANPFDADMQPQAGSGFGLAGLKRRLYLLYARNDLLETSSGENIFTVHVKLPASHG